MWTEAQRRIYRREGEGYPSDLRDAGWARLEPMIPPARTGSRPRTIDMRAAMNAILYLLRTGCTWRYLPWDGYPARSTVYNIFRKFQRDGICEAIWAELHMSLRERMGRRDQPLGGGARRSVGQIGRKGAAKATRWVTKVKGNKIHALSTAKGCRWRVVVHFAATQDRDGAGLVLDEIRRVPRLRVAIVKRSDEAKGLVVLPRRWVVEPTFSWFGHNRRLAKDFENFTETLATFVTLASIRLALMRLAQGLGHGLNTVAGGERLLSDRSADLAGAYRSDADAP